MKRIWYACMLLVFILAVFNSCEKKKVEEEMAEGTITALIGDNPWKATGSNVEATFINGVVEIAGADDLIGSLFYMNVNATAAGSYSLSETNGNFINYSDCQSDLSAVPGAFAITEFDAVNKTISGTFEFNGYESGSNPGFVMVTKGRFHKIHYTTNGDGNNLSWSIWSNGYNGENLEVTVDTPVPQFIQIVAHTSAPYPSMVFRVNKNLTAGTYDTPDNNFFSHHYHDAIDSDTTVSGQLIVTVHNKSTRHIQGKFEVENKYPFGGSCHIHSGHFSINY